MLENFGEYDSEEEISNLHDELDSAKGLWNVALDKACEEIKSSSSMSDDNKSTALEIIQNLKRPETF